MQTRLFLLILITCVLNVGCQKLKEPSILIIAVEDLSSTDIPCTSERFTESPDSGFRTLCQESIRFSHAYTSSLMSAAGLASIFTGQYPFQHGLRHNGQFLKPQIQTVPEIATEKNYRTAFFSGGAPILRKTGLNQGFEVFDDELAPFPELIFRPVKASMNRYLNWFEQTLNEKTFSAIYIPDLTFTQVQTQTKTGEPRAFSFDSQLEEVDENLHALFQKMKQTGRWAQTHIIVVGLTGNSQSERKNEIGPMNLHSENSQVALFIKPAGPQRDTDRSWKVDDNVSVVDLGATLVEILTQQQPQTGHGIMSLLPQFYGFKEPIPQKRALYIETAWPSWRLGLPIRYAIVKDKYIWIYDSDAKIYNSLLDNFELNPLKPNLFLLEQFQDSLSFFRNQGILPFPGLSNQQLQKHSVYTSLWLRKDRQQQLTQILADLARKNPTDQEIVDSYLKTLLEQGDLELIEDSLNKISFLKPFAKEKLLFFQESRDQDFCWGLLDRSTVMTEIKQCPDDLWNEFVTWIRADELNISKDFQRKRFEQKFWYFNIDQSIAKQFQATQQIWDLNPRIHWRPTRTEIAFLLPAFLKEKIQVQNSLRFIEKQHRQSINF